MNLRKYIPFCKGKEATKGFKPSKKLMIVSCPNCSDDVMIYTNESSFRCKKCSSRIEINYNSLVSARYTCPCCEKRGYFRVSRQKEQVTFKCNQCESFIDLKYHAKQKKYLSINLF